MIERCKKSHRAENLVSWLYSSEFSTTTVTHHTAMMYQIGVHAKKQPIWHGGCRDDGSEADHHGWRVRVC
jgi:hypothetical protein